MYHWVTHATSDIAERCKDLLRKNDNSSAVDAIESFKSPAEWGAAHWSDSCTSTDDSSVYADWLKGRGQRVYVAAKSCRDKVRWFIERRGQREHGVNKKECLSSPKKGPRKISLDNSIKKLCSVQNSLIVRRRPRLRKKHLRPVVSDTSNFSSRAKYKESSPVSSEASGTVIGKCGISPESSPQDVKLEYASSGSTHATPQVAVAKTELASKNLDASQNRMKERKGSDLSDVTSYSWLTGGLTAVPSSWWARLYSSSSGEEPGGKKKEALAEDQLTLAPNDAPPSSPLRSPKPLRSHATIPVPCSRRRTHLRKHASTPVIGKRFSRSGSRIRRSSKKHGLLRMARVLEDTENPLAESPPLLMSVSGSSLPTSGSPSRSSDMSSLLQWDSCQETKLSKSRLRYKQIRTFKYGKKDNICENVPEYSPPSGRRTPPWTLEKEEVVMLRPGDAGLGDSAIRMSTQSAVATVKSNQAKTAKFSKRSKRRPSKSRINNRASQRGRSKSRKIESASRRIQKARKTKEITDNDLIETVQSTSTSTVQDETGNLPSEGLTTATTTSLPSELVTTATTETTCPGETSVGEGTARRLTQWWTTAVGSLRRSLSAPKTKPRQREDISSVDKNNKVPEQNKKISTLSNALDLDPGLNSLRSRSSPHRVKHSYGSSPTKTSFRLQSISPSRNSPSRNSRTPSPKQPKRPLRFLLSENSYTEINPIRSLISNNRSPISSSPPVFDTHGYIISDYGNYTKNSPSRSTLPTIIERKESLLLSRLDSSGYSTIHSESKNYRTENSKPGLEESEPVDEEDINDNTEAPNYSEIHGNPDGLSARTSPRLQGSPPDNENSEQPWYDASSSESPAQGNSSSEDDKRKRLKQSSRHRGQGNNIESFLSYLPDDYSYWLWLLLMFLLVVLLVYLLLALLCEVTRSTCAYCWHPFTHGVAWLSTNIVQRFKLIHVDPPPI